MLREFKNYISLINQPQARFGVAVSGGIDSVVLCELCAQAGIAFFLVHCNFKLRGEESERDEQFVRLLANNYDVAVLVKEFSTEEYATRQKCSIQVAARELRYNWFAELNKQDENNYILLAHHANDNIETVVMNFFRGTGIDGLTGMSAVMHDTHCLRPLLKNTRREIEEFAKAHRLSWVEDSSNLSDKYTRNLFRNEIVPSIKKVFPAVEENLLDNIARFQLIDSLYKIGIEKIKAEVIEKNFPDVVIPVHKLRPYQNTSLIYEIIKDFGFGEKQVDEIVKLIDSDSGKYIENKTHQVIKHRKKLIITPKLIRSETAVVAEKETRELKLSNVDFYLTQYPINDFVLHQSENIAQLDAGLISFPLLIRKWKQGDYFYPLGLRKKKKLSRFFIDQRLSLADKEKIWVVESDKKIIWVAGHRIDDRFKITNTTKEVLELSISSL